MKFQGNSGELSGNSVAFCMALNINSVGVLGVISGQRRGFGKNCSLGWFRAIWGLKRLLRK